MLAAYVQSRAKGDWNKYLDVMAFAYNTAVHATTKHTPFYLMYGRKPKTPLDLFTAKPSPNFNLTIDDYAHTTKQMLKLAYDKVHTNTTSRMNTAKMRHDRTIRADSFKQGDLVMRIVDQIKPGTVKAFSEKWKGPYRVVEKINESLYAIKLVGNKTHKRIVNKIKLKRAMWNRPYTTNEIFDEDNVDTQATEDGDVSFLNQTQDTDQAVETNVSQTLEAKETKQTTETKTNNQANETTVNQSKPTLDLQPAKRKRGRPKGSRKKPVKPPSSQTDETIATRTRSKNL
jgi:hypothetical protein